MLKPQLQHFYIPEQQSVYLLNAKDARKHKIWFELCQQQLMQADYKDIELIGQGVYGVAFAGVNQQGESHVFKLLRITLPQHVQDRLEDEAYMLSKLKHSNIPALVAFQRVGKQDIMLMERAEGENLEQISLRNGALPPHTVLSIAKQLTHILLYLRNLSNPIVHSDIKPSNLIWNEENKLLGLVDWGSSVFAQQNHLGEIIANQTLGLISDDCLESNARMGDVYFIGEDQFNKSLSNTRFDEQGVAATLYSLASGQSSRFGTHVIKPTSLGLPKEFAIVLEHMLSANENLRIKAGDYFIKMMSSNCMPYLPNLSCTEMSSDIPFYLQEQNKHIETVCYSSRKSFLKEHQSTESKSLHCDMQVEKYYHNFLDGMGNTEKAFIVAVERLGKYPVVGGITFNWRKKKLYIDSSLALFDSALQQGFIQTLNNMVTLARGIHKSGTFKACFFDAKNTLHIERVDIKKPFVDNKNQRLSYEVKDLAMQDNKSRLHSYFEDGPDPDENLALPDEIISELWLLNKIHHTGCIIFEVLPKHMKIHNYLHLLDANKEDEFRQGLNIILQNLSKIQGVGISGFMKLPYKNTREFSLINALPENFYPKNPKLLLKQGEG